MGAAGVRLVCSFPGRPFQSVGDGGFGLAGQIEESAYFGEGEGDQSSVNWWCGVGTGSDRGLFAALVLSGPPFLA